MELADDSDRSDILGLPSACQIHSKKSVLFFVYEILTGSLPSHLSQFRVLLHQGKKNRKLFWLPAIAPLISVILSTFFVRITHAEEHNVAIVRTLLCGFARFHLHYILTRSVDHSSYINPAKYNFV